MLNGNIVGKINTPSATTASGVWNLPQHYLGKAGPGWPSVGGSTVFDGTGDYLVVTDNAALELSNSSFTIEFWIKTTQNRSYATIFSRENGDNGSGSFIVMMNAGGSTNGDISIFSSNFSFGPFGTFGVSVRDGSWHHVAIVRNVNAWNIYVDGTSRASTTSSASLADVSNNWYIGADQTFMGSREFAGNVSNLRVVKSAVYTTSFTPPTSPLTAISNTSLLTCQNSSGTIADASGNNLTMTTYGDAAASTVHPF